jgi:hypothetical protein
MRSKIKPADFINLIIGIEGAPLNKTSLINRLDQRIWQWFWTIAMTQKQDSRSMILGLLLTRGVLRVTSILECGWSMQVTTIMTANPSFCFQYLVIIEVGA